MSPKPGLGRLNAWLILLVLPLFSGCGQQTPALPGDGLWRLVNYWAIWCKPCREEIPVLNAVDRLPNVTVLGVNFDRKQGEALAKQIEELGIEFSQLPEDPGAMFGVSRPQALPITLVIAPDNTLKTTLYGPQTKASLLAALEETPQGL